MPKHSDILAYYDKSMSMCKLHILNNRYELGLKVKIICLDLEEECKKEGLLKNTIHDKI